MTEGMQKFWHRCSVGSLVALILLCVLWETWLAPLGDKWLALKVLPLLFPLRGVIKRDVYTMQWASMLVLLYFIEGVVRGTATSGYDAGLAATLALIEIGLVVTFFLSTLCYLRPYKRAAKQLAKQAIMKAADNE
ncbi:MAG: hypothetical protein K0S28_843 [Paucimonas sp.]|jgi:uncharacterized membrane protein|nr:hypothetical protein [Paucimonas sp.]